MVLSKEPHPRQQFIYWIKREMQMSKDYSTKYLNKNGIFNLYKFKNQETLTIFEGYPDAAYFYAAGMENATAVGQGKLTSSHLVGLRVSIVKNVIISFDNDKIKDEDKAKNCSIN